MSGFVFFHLQPYSGLNLRSVVLLSSGQVWSISAGLVNPTKNRRGLRDSGLLESRALINGKSRTFLDLGMSLALQGENYSKMIYCNIYVYISPGETMQAVSTCCRSAICLLARQTRRSTSFQEMEDVSACILNCFHNALSVSHLNIVFPDVSSALIDLAPLVPCCIIRRPLLLQARKEEKDSKEAG